MVRQGSPGVRLQAESCTLNSVSGGHPSILYQAWLAVIILSIIQGGRPGSIRVRNWNVHCSLEVLHHLNKFTYTCTWTWLYRYWTNLQISRIYVITLLILIFSSSIDLKRVARLRDGERKKYTIYIYSVADIDNEFNHTSRVKGWWDGGVTIQNSEDWDWPFLYKRRFLW